MSGFADRAPLAAAWRWLDALPAPAAEVIATAGAAGRTVAQTIICPADPPGAPRAAANGYAVRASDCDGASAYNPLALAPGAACVIATGWKLPPGADAVLPFDAAEQTGRQLQVLQPVAPGAGVDRHGPGLPHGTPVLRRGQVVLPQHVACLSALGLMTVPVCRRPRVRLLVPGPKFGADMLTPMLLGLLKRDGAVAAAEPMAALSQPGDGLVLIAGRSGTGPDDGAAAAIRAAGGELPLHGLLLNPGGSAGLGQLGGQPVILLPGDPFACLAAYDMLVARWLRRLSGASSPYAVVAHTLGRKLVSGIGLTDIVPMRTANGTATPVSAAGLGAMLADGFVVVPETSEGHAAGSGVPVHLYGHGPGMP